MTWTLIDQSQRDHLRFVCDDCGTRFWVADHSLAEYHKCDAAKDPLVQQREGPAAKAAAPEPPKRRTRKADA